MKKYLGLLLFALLSSCVSSVQQIDMDGNEVNVDETNENSPIVSALAYNKGTVPLDWKSDDARISITKPDDKMEVALTDVKRTSFYKEFDGIDFRGRLAVRVEAKVVGGTKDDRVKLRLLLTDGNGYVTNGKDVDNTIEATEDFRPYFFRLRGAFVQTFPELQNVNGADITKMEFVVSPTGGAVSAKIIFKSIKVVSDKEVFSTRKVGKEGQKGNVVYSADTKFSSDDWSQENGYVLSQVGDDLVVKAEGVGPRYQKFTKTIETTNATKMKIVVKYEGDVQPFVRFDLVDANGFVTNRKPAMVRLLPGGYQEYTLDYTDRKRQSYPKVVDVDLTRITQVSGYIDPAYRPFSGTLYIKSIELY